MSRLELRFLGTPRVLIDSTDLRFTTRNAVALLAYVATESGRHSRETLTALLWPDAGETHARAALRHTLYVLRKTRIRGWLDFGPSHIELLRNETIIDCEELTAAAAATRSHQHDADEVCGACIQLLSGPAEFCRGMFLEGFTLKDSVDFDNWQFLQTDRFHCEVDYAFDKLTRGLGARGEYDRAIGLAERWLAFDAANERCHRHLMHLFMWSGRRDAALRQYRFCLRSVDEVLRVMPSPETQGLAKSIENNTFEVDPKTWSRYVDHADSLTGVEQARTQPNALIGGEPRYVTVVVVKDSMTANAQVARILQEFGGEVITSTSAEVVATFGFPTARERDPQLALWSALRITAMPGLRSSGVGVDTGRVYCGERRGMRRLSRSTLESVRLRAGALASRASNGEVLAGESAYRLTRDSFTFAPFCGGTDAATGESRVHRVEGLGSSRPGADEFVGHGEELSRLDGLLAKADGGRGQIVGLVGEAGVGKSRLIVEFAKRARADGAGIVWIEGHCLPVASTTSYWPFRDALQRHLFGGSRRDVTWDGLLDFLNSIRIPRDCVVETACRLAPLLSIDVPPDVPHQQEAPDPQERMRATFDAVEVVFRSLSERRTLVLVFEDLHWADSLSMDLLVRLIEALRSRWMMIVCAFRPTERHRCVHLGGIAASKCAESYSELRIRELGRDESLEIVRATTKGFVLPDSQIELILDLSRGNPFYLEQLAHSFVLDGAVERSRSKDEPVSAGNRPVPEAIESAVLGRVARLGARAREVLSVAAIIGPVFETNVLARVLHEAKGLDEVLWELEERSLVIQERSHPEVRYAFRHVLSQRIVYEGTVPDERAAIHARIASALEQLWSVDVGGVRVEQLALHKEMAGLLGDAVHWLLQAGHIANRAFAHAEAVAHLRHALDLLARIPEDDQRDRTELELLSALSVPLAQAKSHPSDELRTVSARMLDLCPPRGDSRHRFTALLGLRRYFYGRGNLARAAQVADEMIAHAVRSGDDCEEMRAHAMAAEVFKDLGGLGRVRSHTGRIATLQQECDPKVDIERFGNARAPIGRFVEATALWALGFPEAALDASNAAESLTREIDHPFTLAMTLFNCAWLDALSWDVSACRRRLGEANSISEDRQFPIFLLLGKALNGWVLASTGRPSEGIDELRRSIGTARGDLLPARHEVIRQARGRA